MPIQWEPAPHRRGNYFAGLLDPPFTNRWRATPGPNYRRCLGVTKAGERCRACAERGYETCRQHRFRRVVLAPTASTPSR